MYPCTEETPGVSQWRYHCQRQDLPSIDELLTFLVQRLNNVENQLDQAELTHSNRGAVVMAQKLGEIATTGRREGVFADPVIEKAARTIHARTQHKAGFPRSECPCPYCGRITKLLYHQHCPTQENPLVCFTIPCEHCDQPVKYTLSLTTTILVQGTVP